MASNCPRNDSSLTERGSENNGITRRNLLIITAKSAVGLTLAPLSSVLADEQKAKSESFNIMKSGLFADDTSVGFSAASSACSAISELLGDINGDCTVDEKDLDIMASEWLTNYASAKSNLDDLYTYIPGSAASEIYVDFKDYSIMADDWQKSCSSACSAISELLGDINGDCTVDEKDLDIMASEWLTNYASAKSNLDDLYTSIPGSAASAIYVDFKDYSVMANDWQKSCTSAYSAISFLESQRPTQRRFRNLARRRFSKLLKHHITST